MSNELAFEEKREDGVLRIEDGERSDDSHAGLNDSNVILPNLLISERRDLTACKAPRLQ